MADFDLRALSAPLEALRADVTAAYQRLDAKWQDVLQQLCSLPIPCTVSLVLSEELGCPLISECLEFRKHRGKKRICLTNYGFQDTPYGPEEIEKVVPYDEWSGEQRIKMLERVPDLFAAAVKRTEKFIEETQE
jgi:hypothetical protein